MHEFLPHTDEQKRDLSGKTGISVEKINERYEALHEFNLGKVQSFQYQVLSKRITGDADAEITWQAD